MLRAFLFCAALAATDGAFAADNAAQKPRDAKPAAAKTDAEAKALSGMSILGNQEAPKALVIVSWKSSQVGDEVGIARALDDARRPVDKDVFMRELRYYDIRSGSK